MEAMPMKTKRIFLAVSITALILVIILIWLKAYYVVIALVAGMLLLGHRELWSWLRRRKLPPIDERIRENSSKSVRNGFIFFAAASAFLMLVFSINLTYITNLNLVHVMSGLFLAGGLVYLLSYIFYDRSEPKLDEKELKRLKTFLLVAGISLGAFVISVFLHNALSALFEIEEPVFFTIAVIICPLALAVGVVGSLVLLIKGLLGKPL
jgi:amino acid transporter